jgi:hypothetical protein
MEGNLKYRLSNSPPRKTQAIAAILSLFVMSRLASSERKSSTIRFTKAAYINRPEELFVLVVGHETDLGFLILT